MLSDTPDIDRVLDDIVANLSGDAALAEAIAAVAPRPFPYADRFRTDAPREDHHA